MSAADLTAEYREHLEAVLLSVPEKTREELLLGLDVVVQANRAEASGPAVTGDVATAVRSAYFATVDRQDSDTTIPPTDFIIQSLRERGVVVLGKGDYDELVKRARCRPLEIQENRRDVLTAAVTLRAFHKMWIRGTIPRSRLDGAQANLFAAIDALDSPTPPEGAKE